MRSAGRADASKFINEDGKCGPPGRGPPSLGNLETTLLRGRRPRPRRLLGGQPSTPETEGKRKCEATSGPLIIPPGLESGALYVLGPRPQTRGCPHTLHPTPFRAGTSAAPTARRRPLVKPFTPPSPPSARPQGAPVWAQAGIRPHHRESPHLLSGRGLRGVGAGRRGGARAAQTASHRDRQGARSPAQRTPPPALRSLRTGRWAPTGREPLRKVSGRLVPVLYAGNSSHSATVTDK